MAKIKMWVFGLIIGLVLGVWGGINIGKGQPLYANPMAQAQVPNKLKEAGKDAIRQSGEALEKTGQAIKESQQE